LHYNQNKIIMKTLYHQLREEARKEFMNSEIADKYPATWAEAGHVLNNKTSWVELTIEEWNDLSNVIPSIKFGDISSLNNAFVS